MRALALLIVAVAPAACTYLSGVEELELRQGGPVIPPAGDASVPPGADAAAAATADAAVPCATALECQEERCKNDLPDSRIPGQVGGVLGVTATCAAGTPFVINPGPDHYYGADVRCTLSPQPTAAAVSSFVSEMNADGWFGYSTKKEGADVVVVGQSTTRRCANY